MEEDRASQCISKMMTSKHSVGVQNTLVFSNRAVASVDCVRDKVKHGFSISQSLKVVCGSETTRVGH